MEFRRRWKESDGEPVVVAIAGHLVLAFGMILVSTIRPVAVAVIAAVHAVDVVAGQVAVLVESETRYARDTKRLEVESEV